MPQDLHREGIYFLAHVPLAYHRDQKQKQLQFFLLIPIYLMLQESPDIGINLGNHGII